MHGITLTKAPADWEILQQENGKASVALKGNFQVHPAAIEVGVERVTPVVRVMREDDNMTVIPWTNADHFTCNEKFQGEFEVTLEIPAGGPYRIDTSLETKSTVPDLTWLYRGDCVLHLGVGNLFIIAGQSNSAGYSRDFCIDPPSMDVHLYRNRNKWDIASHPMNESTFAGSLANEEMGVPGVSPYLAFGKTYGKMTGMPVGLIQTSLGGSPMERWNPKDGDLYLNMLDKIHQTGGKYAGVLWYQGCSDTNPGPAEKYLEHFREYVEATRKELGYGTDDKLFYYRADEEAGADNVVWLYETDEYKEWAAKMKEWSDKGFWSKNAVANNTSPRDAFTNGTSASLIWNLGTCGAVASEVEKSHPDWKPEIYDFNLDKRKFLGSYTGDGAAVLASSKNQERAFMAIDLLKFDEECYNLVRLGIEGENWINPDGEADADTSHKTWRAGDRETAYPFGSALSWPFKNSMYERDREDKFVDEVELTKEWKAKQESVSLTGFTLDDSSIKNELSNLNNAKTKYVPLLDLGLIEDVDATLQEFNDQAEGAGLEKVIDAYKEQIEEYLKNKAE